jgi:hypothetical protein
MATLDTLLTFIQQAQPEDLNAIERACKNRRAATIEPGAVVEMLPGRPASYNGCRGTVEQVKRGRGVDKALVVLDKASSARVRQRSASHRIDRFSDEPLKVWSLFGQLRLVTEP